jgi:hypothetical protein
MSAAPDIDPPVAIIKRLGRWTYCVYIKHGEAAYPRGLYGAVGWAVVGKQRAERKARRELARYTKKMEYKSWSQEVTL